MESSLFVQAQQEKNKQKQQKGTKLIKKENQSDHSLGPDILTGWQSKTLKQRLKQFPLIFTNTTTDYISKTLTSFGSIQPYRVVYMGLRPGSNMNIFKAYSQNKKQKFVNESFLYCKKTIKKFQFSHSNQAQKHFPIRPHQYRLFIGINPTSKPDDLRFSSQFQCGNLDLAIIVNHQEYDLIMRVDSNTKGHTSWFFFKVSNIRQKKKVKFNIINFTKTNILYLEGMKPYVYRTSKGVWSQQGLLVQFKSRATRYSSQFNQTIVSKFLTFTYQFTDPNQEVFFCYCVPYSYSYLLSFIEQMKIKHPQFIEINRSNQSTGGIQIPILTITNFSNLQSNPSNLNNQNHKKKCLATGRLHPGQSQGSWMMQGFIRYLLSPDAHFLRDKMVFKIVPMVNVDGVVLGNFRTGIAGRDLNRVFTSPQQYKEIQLIRNLAQNMKPDLYLDFHGHSAKKNVFLYGPQYRIQDRDYISCRLFPKFISKRTQAFRYYACLFKVSECKKNTARAIMLQEFKTRFAYTIQASTYAYGLKKQETLFEQQKYLDVGRYIGEGLNDFLKYLIRLPKRLQIKSTQQSVKKQDKEKTQKKRTIKNSAEKDKYKNQSNKSIIQLMQKFDFFSEFSTQDLQKQLLEQIFKNQKQIMNKNPAIQSFDQVVSDSDCQNQADDYTQLQLSRLRKNHNHSKEISEVSLQRNSKSNKKKYANFQKIKKQKKKQNQMTLDPKSLPSIQNSLLLRRQIKKNPPHLAQLEHKQSQVKKQRKQKLYRMNRLQSQLSFPDQFKRQNMNNLKFDKFQSWKSHEVSTKQYKKITLQPSKFNQIKFKQNESILPHVNIRERQGSPELLGRRKLNRVFSQKKQKLQPVMLIRKSILPNMSSLKYEKAIQQQQNQEKTQKSIISQILNLHQRRRKNKRHQIKILHINQ